MILAGGLGGGLRTLGGGFLVGALASGGSFRKRRIVFFTGMIGEGLRAGGDGGVFLGLGVPWWLVGVETGDGFLSGSSTIVPPALAAVLVLAILSFSNSALFA